MESNNARLFHYSENPSIAEFVPRHHAARPHEEARVWAINAAFAPLYWFPRNCSRAAFWALPTTTPEDAQTFLSQTDAKIVLAIEAAWLMRVQNTVLYEYEMPPEPFAPLDAPDSPPYHGVYVSLQTVAPLATRPVGDLLARIAERRDIELRVTPSLWPLYDALLVSSLHYSFIRMAHAAPRPKTMGTEKESI